MKELFCLIARAVVAVVLAGGMFTSCKNTPKQETPAVEQAPAVSLTYADVAGMYDTEDSESRVCLHEDGTATWNMIGSLNYAEYTYIIRGNKIYFDVEEVDDDTEPAYIYDPETKTLDGGEEDDIYYLQEGFGTWAD